MESRAELGRVEPRARPNARAKHPNVEPKVVHVKRLAFDVDNNKYKDGKKVVFLDKSLREIIEESTKR